MCNAVLCVCTIPTIPVFYKPHILSLKNLPQGLLLACLSNLISLCCFLYKHFFPRENRTVAILYIRAAIPSSQSISVSHSLF